MDSIIKMFVFFFLHFLTTMMAYQIKICAQCKYFIHNDDLIYGKCVLFPKIEYENLVEKRKKFYEFLVTGYEKPKEHKPVEYFFCSTARECENMCGKEGKKYEERF